MKVHYYNDKCIEFKSNTKNLWGTINEISRKHNDKSSLVDYLTIDSVKTYDAEAISNQFGKYFSTVGSTYANKIAKPKSSIDQYIDKIECNLNSLMFTPCTTGELKKLLTALPNKKVVAVMR